MVSMIGITKIITVPFGLFIKTFASVVWIAKTITVPFGCLLRLVSVVDIT